ncbi:MAG: hypothetical protein O3A28_00760 [Actinomycetota bacterium]|nr:hypothetical protein [Actinomycetota bacterium]
MSASPEEALQRRGSVGRPGGGAGAAVAGRNVGEHLLDVEATSGPGRLIAGTACCSAAHTHTVANVRTIGTCDDGIG